MPSTCALYTIRMPYIQYECLIYKTYALDTIRVVLIAGAFGLGGLDEEVAKTRRAAAREYLDRYRKKCAVGGIKKSAIKK